MDVNTIKAAWDHYLLVGSGVASIGFSVFATGYMLVCAYRRMCAMAKRIGWASVVVLLSFFVWATITGTPTQEDKEDAIEREQGEAQTNAMFGAMLIGGDYGVMPRGSFDGDMTNSSPAMLPVPRPVVASVGDSGLQDCQLHSFPHWRHGVYEDGQRVCFDEDWVFPFGTNHLSSVEVMSWGEILPNGFSTTPIAAFGCRVSLVPEVSEFHYCRTPSNSYQFVWNDSRDQRINGSPISGSIELFRNGDVVVGTNGVGTVTPYVIPFHHDGFGQDEVWVRANFTNAEEILSAGYANWVDNQVGIDLTNGLFKFTAYFPEVPSEATEFVVGDYSVCVTNSGEYVFVFEKGKEYSFHTEPYMGDVQYSCADDMVPRRTALRSAAAWGFSGTWSVDGGYCTLNYPTLTSYGSAFWLPSLRGSPDVVRIGPDDCPLPLHALLYDVGPNVNSEFIWSASDGILLSDYSGRDVSVVDSDIPSWSEAMISVSTSICGYELYSYIKTVYGTNDTPQLGMSFSAPSSLLLRSDWIEDSRSAVANIELRSDISTNGILRIAQVSGSDRILMPEYLLSGYQFESRQNVSLEFAIDGVLASEAPGDVVLRCEFVDAGGVVAESCTATITVVSPKRISVCSDAVEDVAVLVGTNLPMRVVVAPEGAGVPRVKWYDSKLRADRTYTNWREWSEVGSSIIKQLDESGIYAVKARLIFPGPQWTDVRYKWIADENPVYGVCESGDDNHIGVASTFAQLKLQKTARSMLGSQVYALMTSLPARNGFSAVGTRKWKCNAFVADAAIAAGLIVPVQHETGLVEDGRYPPVANEWANGNVEIYGWQHLGRMIWPEPGLIVGHPAETGSGHVGIVDFDGEGIGAGEIIVNRHYEDFLDGTSGFNLYIGGTGNE